MKGSIKKTMKIYWYYVRRYKLTFFVNVIAVILASSINSIIPIYFKKFFDALSSGGEKSQISIVLFEILLFIALFEFLRWIFWRVASFFCIYFESRVMEDLSNRCFSFLHKNSFSYFNDNFTGSLVKRVSYFVKAFENIFDLFFWSILRQFVTIFVITLVLMMKNYYLGLVIISWSILFFCVNLFFSRYKFKYDIRRNEAESEVTGYLSDSITNNSNVKLFNGYKKEINSFSLLNKKVRKLRVFSWNLDQFFESVQTLLMIVLQIGIFYLAIKLWNKNLLTIGDFVMIQSYVIIIIMTVWDFGRMIRRMYQSFSDAWEMTEILSTPHEINDIKNAKILKVDKGLIEFKDVDFNYHKTRKILDKFSLTINSKERVALIGPSGAGKSTVAKIILRNHDVSGGKILIDGQEINKVKQESLWKNVSLVPQDPILFHRTLKENICYGKSNATDEEIVTAAKMAHCHEFIKKFADGYDTYVGERGVKLSGGERQRVAIARAILKNSPILILDEATSSLDSHSEKLIQDALEKLMKDKTVIVIAHRLSTIRKMDRIIYVDEGIIKEEGTHDELEKKKGGFYSKLWNLQVGGFVE